MESIVVALIAAAIPSITTGIVASLQNRRSKREAAKHSILQLMMEDKVDYYTSGKLPANYQSVLHDFDIYRKAGGNSYVEGKIEEYKTWIAVVENKAKPKKSK